MSGEEAAPAAAAQALAAALGHDFRQPDLLREALIHPSVAPERRGGARFGYQRLEFLGDRVLGLVIAEWLLERYPDEPEGALARRLVSLVRAETLADIAATLGLGRFLTMSVSEAETGGRDNTATLADACEAVIGALFLDGGLDAARAFIRRHWDRYVARNLRPPQDPKTALQEWAQGRGLPLPRYEIVSRAGPDHGPTFEIRAVVSGLPPATAFGTSKRVAEKEAAARLLADLDTSTEKAP